MTVCAVVQIKRRTVIGDALRAERGTSAGLDMLNALLCGKDHPDAVVFNAVLQRELLDLVKSYPA